MDYIIERYVVDYLKNYLQLIESENEQGGFLLGGICGDTVFVNKAIHFDNSESGPLVVTFTYGTFLRAEESTDLKVVGTWHTHWEDKAVPSKPDLDGFKYIEELTKLKPIHFITSKHEDIKTWFISETFNYPAIGVEN